MESIKIPKGHTARIEGDTITFVPNASEDELREKAEAIVREAIPTLGGELRDWADVVCEWLATPRGQISVLTFSTTRHPVPDSRLVSVGKALLEGKEELRPHDYEGRAGLSKEGWLSNGVRMGKGESLPVIARFGFYGPDFGLYLLLAVASNTALVIDESLCYPTEEAHCQSVRPTLAIFFYEGDLLFRGDIDGLKPKAQAYLDSLASLPDGGTPVKIVVNGETNFGSQVPMGTSYPLLQSFPSEKGNCVLLKFNDLTAILVPEVYCAFPERVAKEPSGSK